MVCDDCMRCKIWVGMPDIRGGHWIALNWPRLPTKQVRLLPVVLNNHIDTISMFMPVSAVKRGRYSRTLSIRWLKHC